MPTSSPLSSETDAIEGIMLAALQKSRAPGAAVAIVRDDQVIYLGGCGVKDVASSAPVTPDTVFAIASTSKAFTTTAMAILVDEEKMSWDDPVQTHVPYFKLKDPAADTNVTMRDLICHRTGMSRHDLLWFGSPFTREEIIRKIGLLDPSSSFRSKYEYQNIMYAAAGWAIGTASGSSWEEFVQTRLFDPLGMTGAGMSATTAVASPDVATPYRRRGEGRSARIEPIPWLNFDNVAPCGGINAGVRDLSQWLRLQLGRGEIDGKRLVSEKNLRETWTPHVVIPIEGDGQILYPDMMQQSYCLGWATSDYKGQQIVAHSGAINGFRSHVALAPRANLGIAVLTNLAGTWLPEAVRNSLLDLLLRLPPTDWNSAYGDLEKKALDKASADKKERKAKRHKKTEPSLALSAYAGDYTHPVYGTATVTYKKGKLQSTYHHYTTSLTHWHYDVFHSQSDEPPVDELVTFTLNAEGAVATLQAINITFQRQILRPGK